MGARGPAPKRASERRRRNKESKPTLATTELPKAERPEPDGDWHTIASGWFVSLGESGQSEFYEASDWAFACLVAENMSRDLKEPGPISGANLSAYNKAMADLMVTEANRRRAGIELERAPEFEQPAGVTALAEYKKKLAS